MASTTSITVTYGDQIVFHAEGGRLGVPNSVISDFLLFASDLIGASYTLVEDAAKRISSFGYKTSVNPLAA